MADREARILSVTALNEYIKLKIDCDPLLGNIYVRGEISNFTNHRTGHFYFTVKDDTGVIRAVMFRTYAQKLRFLPENGMKVIIHGRVSAFVRDGQYQLYADDIQPDGVGALYIAFEQLKERLEAEGLFSQARKKPLPQIPAAIGVITSPTGAAVRDIIDITGRRFPYAKIIIFPALVQGDGAVKQLIEGIQYFSRRKNADVVIIGRGGGSIEDLWAFNSEALAREIRRSSIPVILAVGHETDFTICDFAADKRAPTPSAAAELAVPDITELNRKIDNITGRMELLLRQNIKLRRTQLAVLSGKRVLVSPEAFIDDRRMTVLNLSQRLETLIKAELIDRRAGYRRLTSVLGAVNPLKIISRGYSAVFKEDGKLVKSVDDVNIGDGILFKTSDGNVSGQVTGKNKTAKES